MSQIRVKTSHKSEKNDIDNKTFATEEKTSEIKEKAVENKKEKPITTKVVVLSLFSLLLLLIIYIFVRYRR